MGMGWHYRRSYETVLVGEKPGAACHWCAEGKDIENIIRPGQYGIRKISPSKDDHPCVKPTALAEHFIGLHSLHGDVVLDPFAGAGWVGVACVRTGRRFIGIEIDKSYFDSAVKRIKAELNRTPLFKESAEVQRILLTEEAAG
jgi:DNA modification methylase